MTGSTYALGDGAVAPTNKPHRRQEDFFHLDLFRKVVSEFLGTALLAYAVMRTASLQPALQTISVPAILIVLVWRFGPISGGHFNPAVTLTFCTARILPWKWLVPYLLSQVLGGLSGAALGKFINDETLQVSSASNTEDIYLMDFILELFASTVFTTMIIGSADSKRIGVWGNTGITISLMDGFGVFALPLLFVSQFC